MLLPYNAASIRLIDFEACATVSVTVASAAWAAAAPVGLAVALAEGGAAASCGVPGVHRKLHPTAEVPPLLQRQHSPGLQPAAPLGRDSASPLRLRLAQHLRSLMRSPFVTRVLQ